MATVYVTEFAGLGASQFGPTQVAQEPAIAAYSFAPGVTSTPSGVTFNTATSIVEIHTDSAICVAFGVSPVAITGQRRMAANQTKFFSVPQGSGYSVAALTTT